MQFGDSAKPTKKQASGPLLVCSTGETKTLDQCSRPVDTTKTNRPLSYSELIETAGPIKSAPHYLY